MTKTKIIKIISLLLFFAAMFLFPSYEILNKKVSLFSAGNNYIELVAFIALLMLFVEIYHFSYDEGKNIVKVLFSLFIIVVLFIQMDDYKLGDGLPFTYILLIVTSIIYCCSQVIESFKEW